MDLGSLFLILALLILVGIYISRPFFASPETTPGLREENQTREHQRSALLAEQERILSALQELDFDYTLGKIPAEEYPAQRAALLKTGADILRRLDAYQSQASPVAAEDRLEAAIASRRADARQAHPVIIPDDELEQKIAARKRERAEKAAGFCPQCGKPVQTSDQFCPRCGASLIKK